MVEPEPSDFTLRIRFRIPARDNLGIDEKESVFDAPSWPGLTLVSGNPDSSIRDSEWLVIKSSGWDSEPAAEVAAESIVDGLRRALARHSMGGDFGRRTQRGGFFKSGLKMLEGMTGRTTLEDRHGPMIFPTDLKPMFARLGSITGYRTVQEDRWRKTFLFSLGLKSPLSDRERTAFDLYTCAQDVREFGDARFVLLFAALETLLEDSPRPSEVFKHVNELIRQTEESQLEESEKRSLVGSLGWLRSHSIRTSGRDLVRNRLGSRTYSGVEAEDFFLSCYNLRNRLLHGQQPFPTQTEVGGLVGGLDQMVSNILAGPVLDFDLA